MIGMNSLNNYSINDELSTLETHKQHRTVSGGYVYLMIHLYVYVTTMVKEEEVMNLRGFGLGRRWRRGGEMLQLYFN